MSDDAEEPTGTGRYDRAAATGRRARSLWIDLTRQLPPSAPEAVIRAWNEADGAVLAFLRLMDDQEDR